MIYILLFIALSVALMIYGMQKAVTVIANEEDF
jgi:uncharacterized membrane protein